MKNKKNKKRKLVIVGLLLVLAVILAAGYYLKSNNTTVEEIIKKKVVAKEKLKILDEDSKTRPFAIMINNLSVARPLHSGLQDAYILYEFMVEGGITRYLALFKDKDTERIGSIRSARDYYIDYALENDAIYVHWGASPQAYSDIRNLKINNIEGGGKYSFRDNNLIVNGSKYSVNSEHTGFSNMKLLKQGLEDKGYRTELEKPLLLKYCVKSIDMKKGENEETANKVDVMFSKTVISNFNYNEETKQYLMSVNDKPHTDYVTKDQYFYKNIITYSVPYSTVDAKNRQDMQNIGEGTGYFISEGYSIPIKWEKKTKSSATKYYLENGDELVVNDGNTYIGIIPKTGSITISWGRYERNSRVCCK